MGFTFCSFPKPKRKRNNQLITELKCGTQLLYCIFEKLNTRKIRGIL